MTAVFEAACESGDPRPDGRELLEARFVSRTEAGSLPTAPWVPEVLDAVFRGSAGAGTFRPPSWTPPRRE